MKIRVVLARGGGSPWALDACKDYGRRIGRYFPFEEREFAAGAAREDAVRVRKEVPARGRLVVLDERGVDLTSPGLAELLERCALDSVPSVVFAIGGPSGHDEGLRAEAWRTIRLSAMVLNHAVARVVLYEQIYRACTIRAGEPYHHA